MQTKHRLISYLVAATMLCGCMVQEEQNDADAVLADDNSSTTADLSNDILIAPTAPTLSIAAAPGALQLSWVDRDNASSDAVTQISLYEYNIVSQQETLITALDDVTTSSYIHTIKPHQLAWDSTSYRVEICTAQNCLSSERQAVGDLLVDAIGGLTANDNQLSVSFGDDVALNADGTVALVSSPLNASALVFFNVNNQWIQASTLTSQAFSNADISNMKVSVSATGETLAIVSVSQRSAPQVAIFDLLGENWIETATINAFNSNSATQSWDTSSIRIKLSSNGERLVFGVQEANPSANDTNNFYNRLWVYDRRQLSWAQAALLSVPVQHIRLPAFAGNSDLTQVFTISALNAGLYLSEFNAASGAWQLASQQFLSVIEPSIDSTLASSGNGQQIALAAWETQSDGQRAAVAWRLAKSGEQWIGTDSVKLAPTSNARAQLRLAADSSLNNIAIGWQASSDANLAFFDNQDTGWQHLFSVPEALNLTRNIGLAQSVAFSADNSTVLIGTSNTGTGGVVTVFH